MPRMILLQFAFGMRLLHVCRDCVVGAHVCAQAMLRRQLLLLYHPLCTLLQFTVAVTQCIRCGLVFYVASLCLWRSTKLLVLRQGVNKSTAKREDYGLCPELVELLPEPASQKQAQEAALQEWLVHDGGLDRCQVSLV